MTKKILFFLCVLCFQCRSQVPETLWYEWKWAFGHPFAALKVKKITKKCNALDRVKIKEQLDIYASGGKADAYRHVFYMAAYAQKIKIKKLRKLGIAHEKTNYRQFLRSKTEQGEIPDSLSSVMDLKNNEVGLRIGSENKKINLNDLAKLVVLEIQNGHAFILKRNSLGKFVYCNNLEIDLKSYARKWNIPKCLVASDCTN